MGKPDLHCPMCYTSVVRVDEGRYEVLSTCFRVGRGVYYCADCFMAMMDASFPLDKGERVPEEMR